MNHEKERSGLTKCPKCKGTDLTITEVVESECQHRVVDGIWYHRYDNNEPGTGGVRVECMCNKCGHIWTGRKGITIDGYIVEEDWHNYVD